MKKFVKEIDIYVKQNPGIQAEDGGLLTISYTILIELVQEAITRNNKKLTAIKAILEL